MIDHKWGRIYLDEKGIVWMTFNLNPEFNLGDAKEYSALWEKVCSNKKRSFIIDLRKTFALVPYDFLEAISSHPNALKWKKAEAILIDTPSLQLMAGFYKRWTNTKFPVKVFTNAQEAIMWVEKFSKPSTLKATIKTTTTNLKKKSTLELY